jgi:hypothetical protein
MTSATAARSAHLCPSIWQKSRPPPLQSSGQSWGGSSWPKRGRPPHGSWWCSRACQCRTQRRGSRPVTASPCKPTAQAATRIAAIAPAGRNAHGIHGDKAGASVPIFRLGLRGGEWWSALHSSVRGGKVFRACWWPPAGEAAGVLNGVAQEPSGPSTAAARSLTTNTELLSLVFGVVSLFL